MPRSSNGRAASLHGADGSSILSRGTNDYFGINNCMKIAITGHTSGIGIATYNLLQEHNHIVQGFSRSNGFDLTNQAERTSMYQILKNEQFDCLINNAYPYQSAYGTNGFMQTAILNDVWKIWRSDPGKTIITIGSLGADHVKNQQMPYSIHKKSIDDTAKQLRLACQYPQVTVIKPSWVDTPAVKQFDGNKCTAQQVAEIILWILNCQVRILDITFEKLV